MVLMLENDDACSGYSPGERAGAILGCVIRVDLAFPDLVESDVLCSRFGDRRPEWEGGE